MISMQSCQRVPKLPTCAKAANVCQSCQPNYIALLYIELDLKEIIDLAYICTACPVHCCNTCFPLTSVVECERVSLSASSRRKYAAAVAMSVPCVHLHTWEKF